MSKTSIEWAAHRRPDGTTVPGHTWNPVTGCTRASAGCDNCYAVTMTRRLDAMGQEKYAGLVNPGKAHFNGVVKCHEAELARPLRKTKATTYFVNSMSDLFHDGVPFDFIDQVFAVMAMCPEHTFIILTKRAERLAEYFSSAIPGGEELLDRWATAACLPSTGNSTCAAGLVGEAAWPLPNVWLGVSVEDQEQADKRIPYLLTVPAAVHLLSIEPMLGPIDLWGARYRWPDGSLAGALISWAHPSIDWVIVGGESGPNARPMHPGWARSLRDQCQAAKVPFFFKQWGQHQPFEAHEPKPDGVGAAGRTDWHNWPGGVVSVKVGKHVAGRLLDGREHNDKPLPHPC